MPPLRQSPSLPFCLAAVLLTACGGPSGGDASLPKEEPPGVEVAAPPAIDLLCAETLPVLPLHELFRTALAQEGTGRCASCHGRGAGDLTFDSPETFAAATVGIASVSNPERRIVEPGWPSRSELFLRIQHDAEGRMPPRGEALPPETVGAVLAWICAGATPAGP